MAVKFVASPYSWDLVGFTFSTFEDYNERLEAAKRDQNDCDFEHEIELIDWSTETERTVFHAVNENVIKYFEAMEVLEDHDLNENQIEIVAYLLENEFEKTFADACEGVESYMIFESEDLFHEYLTESVIGDLSPRDPLVQYFNVEAYARDLILNDDFMEMSNFICTNPNAFRNC